jgi:hypothetical protein
MALIMTGFVDTSSKEHKESARTMEGSIANAY